MVSLEPLGALHHGDLQSCPLNEPDSNTPWGRAALYPGREAAVARLDDPVGREGSQFSAIGIARQPVKGQFCWSIMPAPGSPALRCGFDQSIIVVRDRSAPGRHARKVRTRSYIVRACRDYHRPTWAHRTRLDRDRSCKRRSRAERRLRGLSRIPASERGCSWFAHEPQPSSRVKL
jgi:hypothetical protein